MTTSTVQDFRSLQGTSTGTGCMDQRYPPPQLHLDAFTPTRRLRSAIPADLGNLGDPAIRAPPRPPRPRPPSLSVAPPPPLSPAPASSSIARSAEDGEEADEEDSEEGAGVPGGGWFQA
ncbi:hypothetical protein PVAP13_1KG023000 [Panicum virgatum]|uniref:Uncharacterized protein n=1 Tax=Panicum virgatum TaxID=38727 RepID=A0A8T0XAM2_PANVG|nr:hypothetical protein PVAP13_1KG023000 [Panicum virgatum]